MTHWWCYIIMQSFFPVNRPTAIHPKLHVMWGGRFLLPLPFLRLYHPPCRLRTLKFSFPFCRMCPATLRTKARQHHRLQMWILIVGSPRTQLLCIDHVPHVKNLLQTCPTVCLRGKWYQNKHRSNLTSLRGLPAHLMKTRRVSTNVSSARHGLIDLVAWRWAVVSLRLPID